MQAGRFPRNLENPMAWPWGSSLCFPLIYAEKKCKHCVENCKPKPKADFD